MPALIEARPPFVAFEYRAVEDRTTSIEEGHYASKNVAFAIITPAGSKDRIEKIAEEWLVQMREQVAQERLPLEWFNHYKMLYNAFKEGQEIPEFGTSVKEWPVASPAQVKMLLDLRIRTVEDLANANEEAIIRMGMGGRTLKQKAVDWLSSASGIGKSVEASAALRSENEQLKLDKARLEAENADLQRKLIAAATQGVGAVDPDDSDDDIKINVTTTPTPTSRRL
jgi:hypothetical protein